MTKLVTPKYAIMDFEWLYQHEALETLYELSLIQYDNRAYNLTIKPSLNLSKRWDYPKRLVSLHIDEQKEQAIKKSKLNFKLAFNQLKKYIADSDLVAVYVYGTNDISVLNDYLTYLNAEDPLDRYFRNNTNQYVPIINLEQRLFAKSFSLSVVNMHNVLCDSATQHTFSSLDDCRQLKRVVDFILENDLDKKGFISLLNEKLLPIVDMDTIPYDLDLLKVLYRAYNRSIPKEKFF